MSPRDHFAKVMRSPYFHSENYKNSPGGQFEKEIEDKVKGFIGFFNLAKILKNKKH